MTSAVLGFAALSHSSGVASSILIYASQKMRRSTALALKVAGYAASWRTVADAAGITAFETKYAERGHRLLEMVCDLQQPLPSSACNIGAPAKYLGKEIMTGERESK